ncbi:MAG: histidine phosphatase family protein [Paraglaciecola chathamensis]|jgi:broad specificity phosphatase PhoE|nr:Phosphoglycerate mutase [Glaciecola sp. 4H-3-7+YE-5]
MTCIYLIRHGQASFGKDDYDCLSSLGEQQATHLGADLKRRGVRFDKVFRGSMLRHQQTAKGCLHAMGADESIIENTIVDANWNEYDHQDILAQLNPAFATPAGVKQHLMQHKNPNMALQNVIEEAFSRWMSNDFAQQYTESWKAYQNRIELAIQNVIDHNEDAKHIAVFSSGGPIAVLSQTLLNIPASNLMKVNWTLVNASITKIIHSKKGLVLSSLNDHSAFEGNHSHLITYK